MVFRWPIEIDGLATKNGDFPWRTVSHNQMVIFGIIHQSGRTLPHGFALQEVEAETAAVCCDAFPMWDRWRTRRFGNSWAGSSQLPIITSPWLPLVMPSLVGVYTKQIPNSDHSSLLFLVDGFEYSALFSRQLDKVSFLFGCWSQMSNPEKKQKIHGFTAFGQTWAKDVCTFLFGKNHELIMIIMRGLFENCFLDDLELLPTISTALWASVWPKPEDLMLRMNTYNG